MGNALRRDLLSSMPGCAVTELRSMVYFMSTAPKKAFRKISLKSCST
ncbi:hypothetical protein ACNKHQ_19205 [Shigella flexneri]